MNLEVCGHRVMIKPDPVEDISEGGIILSVGDETKRERAGTVKGVLIGIGKTAWLGFDNGEPWAELGDRVYFAKYSGRFINHEDGEDYIICNDEDIQCIIRGDE